MGPIHYGEGTSSKGDTELLLPLRSLIACPMALIPIMVCAGGIFAQYLRRSADLFGVGSFSAFDSCSLAALLAAAQALCDCHTRRKSGALHGNHKEVTGLEYHKEVTGLE